MITLVYGMRRGEVLALHWPGVHWEARDARWIRKISRTPSKRCGKPGFGHWHAHELRHSGASLMLAQGTPLHVVSEILGHASIAITKDVYGHLVEGDKRAAAQAMSRALFGS
jgi:integrase